ncbi:hypothetical protein C8F04DRAFT_1197758 [Mycena alexandri]|uniref:Uncharacterized protein n=1 Tax=Mycena alexandri TaxID=1745969 RepID=A0AAD6S5K4_9AGAR|nr:hypothetical protein C8F04DRAFT_1197758 [Mycena alexandri]
MCIPEHTLFWQCAYSSSRRMLLVLERLVHLSLQRLSAKLRRYCCYGCGKRHREYYDFVRAGGFAGVERVIRYWLWRMGEIGSVSFLDINSSEIVVIVAEMYNYNHCKYYLEQKNYVDYTYGIFA